MTAWYVLNIEDMPTNEQPIDAPTAQDAAVQWMRSAYDYEALPNAVADVFTTPQWGAFCLYVAELREGPTGCTDDEIDAWMLEHKIPRFVLGATVTIGAKPVKRV